MHKSIKLNKTPAELLTNQLNARNFNKMIPPTSPRQNHSKQNNNVLNLIQNQINPLKQFSNSQLFPSSIEPIKKTSENERNIIYDSDDKETLDFHPLKIKDSQSNSEIFLNKEENEKKLKFTLATLDLYQFKKNFTDNSVTFNDILLLTKNDLIEMGIKLGPRKRLLKFSEKYNKYAREFNLKELKQFFDDNKNLVINIVSSNEGHDSSSRKKKKIDALKASMDNLFREMSESTQIITGYEDKFTQKQQKSISTNHFNSKHKNQNNRISDISDSKKNENEKLNEIKDDHPNNMCLNKNYKQINQQNLNKKNILHSSQKKIQNDNKINTFRRNWSHPKSFMPLNTYTFTNTALIKSPRCWAEFRHSSPQFQRSSLNNDNKLQIQPVSCNNFNKNKKMKQTYKNLVLEIEAYQQEYQNMKIKNRDRNSRINNILQKTEPKLIISDSVPKEKFTKQENIQTAAFIEKETSQKKPIKVVKRKKVKSEVSVFSPQKPSNGTCLDKFNEIVTKKQKLRNTLNECQESINHKRLMIKRLNEEDKKNWY